ncbi:MAG TPA: TonB-dependent receptor, partial [Phenylobacterium sp.]
MKVRMKIMLRSALLMSAASAGLLAAPSFAQAQTTDGADVGEIVVTGSRLRRDTFSAPLPISVLTAETIRESGQASIGDLLLDQPNINPAANNQNTSNSSFLAGQSRADIRGIGPTRTLVLMDGRRLPFSDASSPAVDLNTIPSLMVERVETLVGGASAVYGSEAIAGVVNFVMKKEQQGLEVDLTGGVSEEGDGEEFRTGFNWGAKFLDDRLNVLVGGEYASIDKIMQKDRDWAFPGVRRDTRLTPQPIIPNSHANTSPYATFQLVGGALGTARAVTRDVRDNGLSIVRLSAACSTATVQPDCQDPALFDSTVYNALQGKVNRGVLRTYVDYRITDQWKAFVDASYTKVTGYGFLQPAFSSAAGGGTMPVVLRGDNAFLAGPTTTAQQLRAEWLAAGKTFSSASTAQVGKFWDEFGGRDVKSEREQSRVAGGFEGAFQTLGRDVNVDGYVQYSRLDGSTISYGMPNVARVQQATDAVIVNGQVVCRSVAARAAGCVPWDLINGASREAVLWANGVSDTDQKVTQTVGGLNFATNVFELSAGPVSVAFGGEYRRETSSFVQDALGASGALYISPVGRRAGSYSVKEAYGEVRIPILKDLPFAEELSIELAGRASDYTTVGDTHQYRLHAEWAPFRDIRFRATEATAVRAPNIVELFAPQTRTFTPAAVDPCDAAVFRGASAAQQAARRITCAAAIPGWNPATFQSNFGLGRPLPVTIGGNPNLDAEKAHTYEYGVVLKPRWVPGLSLSMDFFKYNIAGQVGAVTLSTLFQDLCYDSPLAYGSNPFCAQITRDPSGAQTGVVGGVSDVLVVAQNVAKVKVEGWDYSASYGFRTEDLFGRDYGAIALRADATWTYRFAQQGLPGQRYTQLANTINNATPEWKANASARWSYDKYAVTWSTLYIGSTIANVAFQPNQLTRYKTGDYFRHDLRASYRVNDDIAVRAGVINLLDRNPPQIPDNSIYNGTT